MISFSKRNIHESSIYFIHVTLAKEKENGCSTRSRHRRRASSDLRRSRIHRRRPILQRRRVLGYENGAPLPFRANFSIDRRAECMKDLIGFLKRDTSSCLTRRQLGCTQILQTDLLSILVNFWEDENLLNACIK